MAKIPGNKDKASFDEWMVRISFAEAGEADTGFEITGLDVVRKLALDKIMIMKSEKSQAKEASEKGNTGMNEDTKPEGTASPESKPEPWGDDKIHVMIVDDEPIVGKRLRPALSKRGFEVEVFEDPAAALERLGQREFDIVVTDLRMEQVDGIQVLEHIMSTSERTRVILITGYATVEVAREALVKGAFDFIAKPFKPKDLRAVINKAALSLGHQGSL
jgi:CheY-like chemotaxis protein